MAPQKYYTVGVSNKFAAFGSDSDASDDGEVILSAPPPNPAEQTSHIQQSPAGRRREHAVPAPPAASLASPQREQRSRPQRGGGRGGSEGRVSGFRGRGGRGGGRDGGVSFVGASGTEGLTVGEGYVQQQSVEGEGVSVDVPRFRRGSGYRGRGRGRGGAVGVGRREYDRHSAGARGSPGRDWKKGGGGAHNWGVEDGAEQNNTNGQQTSVAQPTQQQGSQDLRAEGEGTNATEDVASPNVAEPEEDVIDWETYKRQQAEKRMHLPTFVATSASNIKITTEADLKAAGYVKLARGEEEETDEEGEEEEAQTTRDDRPKKKSVNLFEFVHNEGGSIGLLRKRDDDRRGRRGGRGGGGAALQRRQPAARDAPDLYDQRAFPTLGGQA